MTLRAIQRYSKTGDSKTGVICRGVTQDLSPQHSVLEGVRAREAPPIPEGLQTVTGGWGNGCHFRPWCSHWSIGSPVLVHLSPTFMQVTKQTQWVSLAPQKHLDSKKCNKVKGKKEDLSDSRLQSHPESSVSSFLYPKGVRVTSSCLSAAWVPTSRTMHFAYTRSESYPPGHILPVKT